LPLFIFFSTSYPDLNRDVLRYTKMGRNDELVAVVTGGSRGIGKGVARALAECGATVYVAGRSQASGIHTSPGGALLSGTIQEAVEEVNSLGGRGIAVACDLSIDEEIRSLFERVRQESGHLNILVNNAAYLNEKMFVRPFGKLRLSWPTSSMSGCGAIM